jgi:hypothetical protein
LLERDAFEEARELAEAAWMRRQRDDIRASERAATAFVLATACWGIGEAERPRAIALVERAVADYAAAGEADGEEATAAKAWLERTSRWEHP